MDINKQSQSAGDNSKLIQAQNIYYTQNGITEERAREIWREQYESVIQNQIQEAKEISTLRVSQLENKIIPKLLEHDKTFRMFSDPAFLHSLKLTQISAITSDKDEDFDLLVELLFNRAADQNDRGIRLSINKAIEVVSDVPEDALIGLVAVCCFLNINAPYKIFIEIFRIFDNLFYDTIGENELPSGVDWIEHLDLLSLIRINTLGTFLKSKDIISGIFKQYMLTGLPIEEEKLKNIKEEFKKAQLPLNLFVEHPLKEGHEIIDIYKNSLDDLHLNYSRDGICTKKDLNEQQKQIIKQAKELLNIDDSSNESLKNKLMEKWNSYPRLQKFALWWDTIPTDFSITPAGKALVKAFLQRKTSKNIVDL